MYTVKVVEKIKKMKKVIIADGEQQIDENGNLLTENKYDSDDNLIDTVPLMNNSGQDMGIYVWRSEQEIQDEKDALVQAKLEEIQQQVEDYEAAKVWQKANGGPGPVADIEIMKICNEHNCEFEIIFEEMFEEE
jgi:hypothetical protein